MRNSDLRREGRIPSSAPPSLPPEPGKSLRAVLFACTRCGFCCQGETTVSLDEADQERMARVLGLSREETRDRYWRVTGTTVQMKVRDGHCIFYDQETGCTVHEGRPWRCRQWPLHPSIITDENNYRIIRSSCPGLSKDMEYQEFCRLFREIQGEEAGRTDG